MSARGVLWGAGVVLALTIEAAAASGPAAPISLALPIDCRLGETCFIQQYPDHDPGPGALDYRCGSMTYDGHDGIDFRLPDMAAQRAGVDVLAAAAGTVKATRDDMDDLPIDASRRAAVAGRECGNGAVLVHPGGWETQYCHMAKGSVRVRPGDQVKTGEVLGRVGESGDAAFPHLHLSVRRDGQKLDPFAYDVPPGACGRGTALWTAAAAKALAYRSPDLINWGFSDGPVAMEDIEAGGDRPHRPGADPPALVAYVRVIGLRDTDALVLDLRGPGRISLEGTPIKVIGAKAQYMKFAGIKRPARGWPKGVYRATFVVTRGNTAVLERSFEIRL